MKSNKKNSSIKSNQKIICLLAFGRSGSLFLHSLLDGHPQISTLPGYFFKGWFGDKTWSIFNLTFKRLIGGKLWLKKFVLILNPNLTLTVKKMSLENQMVIPNGLL